MKKIISYLLLYSFFIQATSPVFAINTIEHILHHEADIRKAYGHFSARSIQPEAKITAAGTLHYASHEGKIWVALGGRKGGSGYCNFGGESEASDISLAQTASRETAEETFKTFTDHPAVQERDPYVDVVNPKGSTQLYRMYFSQVSYISADIFKHKQKETGINIRDNEQEFDDFAWVLASDLYTAAQSQERVFIPSNSSTSISLYEPFYWTLRTPTSLDFLKQLSTHGKLNSWSPLKGKVYFLEDIQANCSIHPEQNIKISWDVPKLEPEDLKGLLRRLQQDTKTTYPKAPSLRETDILPPTPHDTVPFGVDGFGRTSALRTVTLEVGGASTTLLEETIEFSRERQEKQLAQAVGNHANVLLELKARFQKKSLPAPALHQSLPHWDSAARDTMTESHLRLVLGPEYSEAEQIPGTADQDPQRRADIENLRKYFAKYKDAEYAQTHNEFKREIHVLESDYERFADMMEMERRMKHMVPIIHATEPDIHHLYRVFTHHNAMMELSPVLHPGQLTTLRGTYLYFRDLSNMQSVLTTIGTDDYERGRPNMVLCGNIALTAGRQSTRTSSSSIEYFLNSHSVEKPAAQKKFEEATQLLGINIAYTPYEAIYAQFVAHLGRAAYEIASKASSRKSAGDIIEYENSAILLWFLDPAVLDTYTYAAHGGGKPYIFNLPKEGDTFAASHMYHQVQEELMRSRSTTPPEPFSERHRDMFAEIRVLAHPELTQSSHSFIQSFDRFPLTSEQEKRMSLKLFQTIAADIGQWLSEKTTILTGSLPREPLIKSLYRLIYKGTSGETLEETAPKDSLPHMIRHGYLDGVQEFIRAYPDMSGYDEKALVLLSLESGNNAQTAFLVEEVFHQDINVLLNDREIIKTVRKIIKEESNYKGLEYLFGHYDLSRIPTSTRKFWAEQVLHSGDKDLIAFIHQHIFPITEEQIHSSIANLSTPEQSESIQAVIQSNIYPIAKIAEWVFDTFMRRHQENSFQAYDLEELCMFIFDQETFDYRQIHASTQNPYFFTSVYFRYALSDAFQRRLLEDSSLFSTRSAAGHTFIEFFQINILQGTTANGWLMDLLNRYVPRHGLDFHSVSHPSYRELFRTGPGMTTFPVIPSFFKDFPKEGLLWRKKLEEAKRSNNSSSVKDVIANCPDPYTRMVYASALVPSASYTSHWNNEESWQSEVETALTSEDSQQLSKLMDSIPTLSVLDNLTSPDGKFYNSIFQRLPAETQQRLALQTSYAKEQESSLLRELRNVMPSQNYGRIMELVNQAMSFPYSYQISSILLEEHDFTSFSSYAQDQETKYLEQFKDVGQTLGKVRDGTIPADVALARLGSEVFKDEHAVALRQTLPFLFPNPLDIITKFSYDNTRQSIFMSAVHSNQNKVLQAFLDYLGYEKLKYLSQNDFSILFYNASEEIRENIMQSGILLYEDEEHDFFSVALQNFRPSMEEFVFRNYKKLFEINKTTGLLKLEKMETTPSATFFQRVFEAALQTPEVFEVQSRDGLNLKEMLPFLIKETDKAYPWAEAALRQLFPESETGA